MIAIRLWMLFSPNSASVKDRLPWADRLRALITAWPVLVIFLAVVLYFGFFTPTEAAAVGAAGTCIAALASGNMNLAKFKQAILATASSSAMTS